MLWEESVGSVEMQVQRVRHADGGFVDVHLAELDGGAVCQVGAVIVAAGSEVEVLARALTVARHVVEVVRLGVDLVRCAGAHVSTLAPCDLGVAWAVV